MAESGQHSRVDNGYGKDSEEDDMVEEELPGHIVFQCNSCNTILGDTWAWVTGNTEMGTFTIERASDDVELGTSIKASQEGMDEGSTYKDVKCSCKAKVGRYYLATTSAVDHLRRMYTLYAASIKIYRLNCGYQDAEDAQVTAGGLPLLSQHELTIQIRKAQGTILQMCKELGKCSKALDIPTHPALCIDTFDDPAPPSNQEASPSAKINIDNEEDPHHDNHSDEELSHSRNTKSLQKNSSVEGRRKRDRSEYNGIAQSSSTPERKNKKSKR